MTVRHRIVFDLQALQNPATGDRGIARYAVEHVTALLAADAPIGAIVLNPLLPADRLPAALRDSGLVAWNRPDVMHGDSSAPVCWHIASPFADARPVDGLVAPHLMIGADAVVVTLYDLIPYVMADEYQQGWWARQFLRRRAELIRQADLVLTISEHTARDAVAVLGVRPERLAVIGAGASEHFNAPGTGDDPAAVLRRDLPGLREPFVLTVTGDDPRKDPETLISGFARLPHALRDRHQLVVACNLAPETEQRWRAYATLRGLAERDVLFTDYVADDVLRALYQRAALFAFTSRHEGFGLPLLEAARCGCPVITADNSALPEVLEMPAATFPTGDTAALAALMERALESRELRDELRRASARAAQRHSWARVAERTLDAYKSLAPRTRRSSRPYRLALVGPFPPAGSGVAIYDARVADELAQICELDCFAEGSSLPGSLDPREFRCFPHEALGRTISPGSYDQIVYVLGNSFWHLHTLELALRYPGVVWLHDAHLSGLYLVRAGLYRPGVEVVDYDGARESMRAALARCLGPDAPDLGDNWWRLDAYPSAGVTLNEEVCARARAVVLNTRGAQRLVRVAEDVPVSIIPHAIPSFEVPRIEPEGDPWVVALGIVDRAKRPHELVRAIATVRATAPARLAFVGDAAPELAAELEQLADDCGVELVLTGYADSPTYRSWIARAACVVQLRTHSRGESSGAVADAIAAARPIITSIASAHELPVGVVDLVPPDVGVADLAASIRRVLHDTAHRAGLETAARAFAPTWTFASVAAALLDAARAAPLPAFPASPFLHDVPA